LIDIEKIMNHLKYMLDEKRYIHSIGTMEVSIKLADRYDVDKSKAKIAGLVHDCAKCFKDAELLNYAMKSGIVIDNVMLNHRELLHGPAGKYMAETVFQIRDQDILNSIAYHTTGRENMSKLEKIIYVADLIEPSRCFDGVEKLRKLAYVDLEKTVGCAMANTINYVIKMGGLLHPLTIFARNQLILNESGRES